MISSSLPQSSPPTLQLQLFPQTRPEGNTLNKLHLVTNQYGIVYTFSFTLAPEPCAAALEISLADNFNNSISLGDPVIATPTSSPSFTLPTCAPYTPSFTYTEAYVTLTDITLSPNNLATTAIDPTAPATYTESRSVTNNLGFLSEFSFSVTVSECSPTLSLSFLTVDGTATLLDPAALSLSPTTD